MSMDEYSALEAELDEVRKDRDEWKGIAETRLTEIRRLREVIRTGNEKKYWAIDGFGVELNAVYPMLDAEKLRGYLKETYPDGDWFDDESGSRYRTYTDSDNVDRLHMLEKRIGERVENLASLICRSNEKSLIEFGGNGNGRYFILYLSSYPWSAKRSEIQTQEEAEEHIYGVLKRFLTAGVEKSSIVFDYVNEVGMS